MKNATPQPDLSIVINTRDHPDQLRALLDALQRQELKPERWEIVVVDDGSRDDETAKVAQSFAENITCRLIRLEPTGRAGARNAGIQKSCGKIVLFLGDDIIPANRKFMQAHLDAHEALPGHIVIGHTEDLASCPSEVFRKWWNNLRFDLIKDPEDAGFDFFYTSNASVARDALLQTGGFDENFDRYGWEDIDIGLRLEKRGLRIRYCPKARAGHRHPHVDVAALAKREYELGFTGAYFVGKWAHAPCVENIPFFEQINAIQNEPGPIWRQQVGLRLLEIAERVAPFSSVLAPIYKRVMWSARLRGLHDGTNHYATILDDMARQGLIPPKP